MNLNLATVFTLFRTELRMVLRDKRMILTSIVLPLVVTPLMFLGSSWSMKKREKTLRDMTYQYAVTGSESNALRSLISATRARLDLAEAKTNQAARFRFSEKPCADPATALAKGDIHFIVEGLTGQEAVTELEPEKSGSQAGEAVSGTERKRGKVDGETPIAGAMVVRFIYRGDRDDSAAGMSRLNNALRETRRTRQDKLLAEHGFPLKQEDFATVSKVDLASKAQVAGLAVGRLLTVFLLLFILSGGAVVAIDSLAGEKERGTLETLLTTAARRVEILAAKHMVIVAVALLITLIQIANLVVYVAFKLLPVTSDLASAVTPGVAILLLFLFLPLAALAASVLLLVSGRSRTYKEAQMYFAPVLLLGLIPALAPCLPGLPLRSAIVLVPVANLAMCAKEVLVGSFDWPFLALSWLVTAGTAVWVTRRGARLLSTEKLVTASEKDSVDFAGGPALFERHVLRWYAALWGALIIISNYTASLDLRIQVVINLIGIFFGGALLMIRRYHLDPRKALALRLPRPAVWLGVLFAAPGGLLTALGLFRLANVVLPVSTKTVESFNESVMPQNIPFLQLVFCLTVLPGIFEEIAFRGLLLHGLRRRLHPVALAVVVGLAFGFFHVALFRFVPTAFLGMFFAAVVMITGSIYPAMLWHALNNGLGLLANKLQIPESGLDPICYVAGAGMLAVAFWIFWRNRRPYPGLRSGIILPR